MWRTLVSLGRRMVAANWRVKLPAVSDPGFCGNLWIHGIKTFLHIYWLNQVVVIKRISGRRTFTAGLKVSLGRVAL